MDGELLQRVMDLAERTGDRVIVVNPESGVAHAILPFDHYEELVEGGTASLRDLGDECLDPCSAGSDDDDLMANIMMPDDRDAGLSGLEMAIGGQELGKTVKQDAEAIKVVEQSQKEAGGTGSLDVLDDDANEEQYYLEPLE